MANSDKNIRITTNNSTTSLPKIAFTGQNNSPITLYVLDDNTLSFEGSAGQLFSINNVLSTGYIFSINDISGIPSLRINADGTVGIAEFTGNVGIGLTNPTFKFQTNGSAGFGASIWSSPSFSSSISGVTFNNGAITSTGVISSTGRVSIQISDTAALAVKNAGGTSILNVDTTNGITSVLSSTGSTSTTTGALVITGGVGIGQSVNVGGRVGIGTNILTGQINIRTSSASTPAIVVQGSASQTADYAQFFTSTGTTSLSIDKDGKITFPSQSSIQLFAETYSSSGRIRTSGPMIVYGAISSFSDGINESYLNSSQLYIQGLSWTIFGGNRWSTNNAVRIQPTSTSVVPLVVQLQNASWTSGNAFEIQNNSVLKFNVDYAGNTSILSTAGSASTTTGALVVSGGVGIGGSVIVGGRVGIGTVPNLSMLNIQTSSAGTTGLSILASTSQSAPLLEWWSYGGIIGLNQSGRIKPTGELYLGIQTVANLSSGTNPLFSLQGRGTTEGMLIKGFNSGASEVIFEVQGNTAAQLFGIYGDGGVNAPRINVTNSTGSTSTSSGALVVTGGVGIGDNLYVNGRVDASNFKAWVENRTLSSVNTCVGIGTFFIDNGAHNILISLNVSDGGYSVAKIYTLTSNYNIGGWSIVAPLSSTGGYNNNPAINFQLEAYQGFNSLTLRARSLGTGGSLKIYVQNVGQNTATFTAYNSATSETAISTYHQYAFTSQENNVFKINSSLGSTSTFTGALVVTGGVGIGQSLFTSSSYASSISGVVLNNGSVTLSGTYTQSNSNTAAFVVKNAGGTSILNVDTTNSIVSVLASTASTSTSTGALAVSGGVGIGGTLNVGSVKVINNFTHTPNQTTIGGASGWVANSIPSGMSPDYLKYLNNKFIGIGGTYIYYSDDAITWSSVMVPNLDVTKNIADVTYGEGKYVFVQYYTANAGYSTNLANWTVGATLTYNSWLSVEYGNGRFVASSGGSPYSYSLDGITWNSVSDARFGFNNAGIQFLNGYFYITNSNSIVRSTDGITWQTCNTPALPYGLAYGNGLYVGGVYNSGTIIYSYDGLNFSSYSGSSFVHNNSWFYNGVYYLTTNNNNLIRYSTDGFNWANSTGFPSAVRYLRYAQGKLWAGSGTSLWSAEGTPGRFEVNPIRTGNLDDVEIGRYSPNSANFIDVSVNNNLNVSSQYSSTSPLNGALTVAGGVGIGGSLYVSSATAISGVVINNGVITGSLTGTATTSTYSHQSGYATTSGNSNTSGYATTSGLATTATYSHLSGYGITAGLATTATYAHQSGYAITSGSSGSATTANNINVANALTNSAHTLLFSPTATGSGVAVSSNNTLSFNPSSYILSTSGLAITATTVSNSTAAGALQVAGGVGISGRLSFNQAAFGTTGIATNPTMAMIGSTGDPIYMSVLEDNSISFEGSQGQLFSITPNLSTGYIYSVNDITGIPLLRANANANVTANEYAGNFGIGLSNPGYKLHVVGSVGFTSTTASTSTTTGTLVVSGGVGIGGSLYVNSPSNISSVIINNGVITGNLTGTATTSGFATTASYSHQAGYAITAGSATTAITAVSTTSVSVASAGNSNLAHPILITNNPSSGSAVSSDNTFTFNPSTEVLSVSGVAVTSSTGSSNTTTGALVVSGGVGIGGSLNVGNKTRFNDDVYISSLSNNALYSSGSGGVAYNWSVGGNLSSNKYFLGLDLGLHPVGGNQSIVQTFWGLQLVGNSGVVPSGYTPSSVGVRDAIGVLVPNQQANRVAFGIIAHASQTADLQIWTSSTASTSSPYLAVKADGQIYSYANIPATSFSSGALVVSGGVGIGGSLFVNGDLTINGTTTTINSVTLSVDDKNIELGSVSSPSDVTAEGGGITLKGSTDKIINWYSGVGWSSSESWNLGTGNTYKINNVSVLNATTLGTGVTNSSLTSVGTITSGVWAGTLITANYGGVGLTTPFTVGDILYANTSTTWGRLTTGTSGHLLSSTGTGSTPSYVNPITLAVGSATTASNLRIANANSNLSHPILFTPSSSTSGSAVSSDSTFSFNSSTEILSVSGLAVTSTTSSSGSTTGALTVAGGVGIGGTVNIAGDETVLGRLYYSQSTVGVAGTSTIPSISFIGQDNNPITLSVLTDNTLSFEGSSGQLFSINNNLSSGTIFSVNDISGIPILRANANGTLSMGEFSGNVGVGLSIPSYKLHVSGSAGFSGTVYITGNASLASNTASTSTTTGALTVSGGVGIGGSLYVASATAISGVTINAGVITGSLTGTASTATYAHQSGYATTSGFATSATSASIATTSYSVNVNSASTNANHFLIFSPNATGSGVALSTESALVYNPSTDILSVSGLAITSGTSSTTTSTGALIVSGGVGVSGTLNTNRIKAISKITFEPGTGTSAVTGWTGIAVTSIYRMIYGGNKFVGVGGSYVAYSDDGVNFSYTTIPGSSSSASYADVAYGNGVFVAVNQEDVAFIAYSYDGAAWGTTSIPRGLIRTVGFGNGKFLAFSEAPSAVYSSTDGRNWSTIGSLGEFGREVYFANGYFLSPRGVSLYYSADGISWKTANTPGSNYIFNITYGKGLYIAADYLSSQYFTSTDLVTWTPRSIPYKVWTGASYVNGVFYLIPNNDYSLYHSLDGINWSTTSFSTPIGGTNKMFTANDRLYFFSGWGSYLWSTDATTGTLMAKPFYNGEIENTRIGAIKPDSATFTHLTALSPVTFTSATPSTASDNGALVVFGGVGIGGTLSLAGRMNISSSFASTSTSTGALIVSGGVGIGGSLHTSTSVTSSVSGLRILNGSLSSATSTIAATNKIQISVSDTAAFTVKNGGGTNVLNIDTTNGVSTISSSTGSTNTSTGALVVTGSVGVGGTLNVNSVVTYNRLQNQSFSGASLGSSDGRSINTGALIGHDIITYGNGLFVTNSSWGAYNSAYSTDGTSWTASSLPVNQGYPVSIYGNGYFVLAATGATNVLYSANGTSWSQVSIGNTLSRTDGAYGNGKYVIVGTGQTYNYSTNLTTWTSGTLPITGNWRIAYGNGVFVALGYGTRQIIYSYDGIYWNLANTKVDYALNWTGLKYANGRFIASVYSGGGSAYSLDGINWYSAVGTGGENLEKISYGNGVYFVSSYGNYYTSGDGTTYNNSTPWSVAYQSGNTAYGLGKFQAIGRYIDGPTNTVTIEPKFTGEINNVRIGAITPASGDFTNLSSTGSANLVGTVNAYDLNIVSKLNQTPVLGGFAGSTGWTSAGLLAGTASNYALAFGNGLFVQIRKSTNYTSFSPDGRQWVGSAMPFTGDWMSIAWGVDKFVAVASAGTTGAYSGNGISWTSMSMPATAQGWYAVTYGDEKFVAVGNGATVAYSSDGISWTGSAIANTNWTGIVYGNGTFVAVSGFGLSGAYSYDGINWNLINLPTSGGTGVKFITYGNGYFIVTNYVSTAINYSRDGINWSTSTQASIVNIHTDIAYGNGVYSILNYREASMSYDAINWFNSNAIADTDWQAVAYGNNRFVATSVNTGYVGSIDGPSNTLNLHPKFTGDIDNVRIGAKQPAAAEFTNLAAQQPVRFTANTASININTGALVVVGGVGIGQTLFTSSSYASSVSGVILNNGTITGTVSGYATTSNNIRISGSGNSNLAHPVLFTPSSSSSGSAVSSDNTFFFNPFTEILSVSGLAVTASTASTSPTTGALIVTGGVGVGATITVGLGISVPIITSGSSLLIKPGTDSTNAIQFTRTSSALPVLTLDTLNSRVGIGVTNPEYDLEVNGEISATTKSFLIPHPTKENMKLRYGSLEGPENGVYIRGELKDSNEILLPDYWEKLVDHSTITIHLTPIGNKTVFVKEIRKDKVIVGARLFQKIHCFYSIWAERKDVPKLKVEF